MFRVITNLSFKNTFRLPVRHYNVKNSQNVFQKYKKSVIISSGLGSLFAYDYFMREGEKIN
jgi:hypothetical protein